MLAASSQQGSSMPWRMLTAAAPSNALIGVANPATLPVLASHSSSSSSGLAEESQAQEVNLSFISQIPESVFEASLARLRQPVQQTSRYILNDSKQIIREKLKNVILKDADRILPLFMDDAYVKKNFVAIYFMRYQVQIRMHNNIDLLKVLLLPLINRSCYHKSAQTNKENEDDNNLDEEDLDEETADLILWCYTDFKHLYHNGKRVGPSVAASVEHNVVSFGPATKSVQQEMEVPRPEYDSSLVYKSFTRSNVRNQWTSFIRECWKRAALGEKADADSNPRLIIRNPFPVKLPSGETFEINLDVEDLKALYDAVLRAFSEIFIKHLLPEHRRTANVKEAVLKQLKIQHGKAVSYQSKKRAAEESSPEEETSSKLLKQADAALAQVF